MGQRLGRSVVLLKKMQKFRVWRLVWLRALVKLITQNCMRPTSAKLLLQKLWGI
jgi:hypothetical protein